MRNLLALLGLAIVLFGAIGYSRGWYSFTVTPGSDGKKHIAVDVDTKKIGEDGSEFKSEAGTAIDKLKTPPASATQPPTTTSK